MASSNPRPLTDADIPAAAAVLLDAFADDPGLLFVLPDSAERARLAPRLSEMVVRFALRYGSPHCSGDPLAAVALWFAPDDPEPDPAGLAELGLTQVPELIGPDAWIRLQVLLGHLDALHPLHAPEPHWYLAMLGTASASQGQGLGMGLVHAITARADESGVTCYLETPNEHNVGFYDRSRFSVVGETDIPTSSVHIWMMRRDSNSGT